ncbi:MAG: pyrroline-5-carboxylate reductase [Phycisphaerales bacterium]|nr:pyrroline-5-carboxylate reductase [Phycisphaerales bacterium]
MPTPPTHHAPRALLAIIGGGNMGRAIILGALDAKLLAPAEIIVCETDAAKLNQLKGWGVQVTSSHQEALDRLLPTPPSLADINDSGALASCGGQLLLAIKPQSLPTLAAQLAPTLAKNPRVVISILAGTPTQNISNLLGPQSPIVRVMPNTPARLRKSMTAISLAPNCSKHHMTLAYDLFASIGEVVQIDESLMDAYTALAGSGPAYLFYLAEAMTLAARDVGFDQITADRIVRQTLAGAAALLVDSHETPQQLRAAVTSKGGTTEAACNTLDSRSVIDAFRAAIAAGRDRGRELAAGSSPV